MKAEHNKKNKELKVNDSKPRCEDCSASLSSSDGYIDVLIDGLTVSRSDNNKVENSCIEVFDNNCKSTIASQ